MCSGCNIEYSEIVKQERFKYLDVNSIQIILLHDIIKLLSKIKEADGQ